MECFSCEAPESQRVDYGKGSWWNALLVQNTREADKLGDEAVRVRPALLRSLGYHVRGSISSAL